ncbi:MAG: SH3 domain-containing protein [Spirochaetota bacterium]
MKRLLVAAIVIALSLALSAETLYVSSLKVKLYSSPAKNAQVVTTMRRGDSVQVQKKEGNWLYVSSSGGNGWVQSLFVKETRPAGSISILGNKTKTERIHARERASSDVTAASARGLLAENENAASRTRLSGDRMSFNPQDMEDVESIDVTEDELIRFLESGNVQ